ncbi:hypothetical protein LC087_06435 [Bacillus carboniphilus]|uniref:Uncharacterized protein n=1 Tax=Bacillus carboniphilus TaxID=86663 RepID=A0ABY9JWI6_9BACI|nr:hypothetical protein [Bacillus carboniphilus]WLR43762.1 hypothetical protein LC087_06435 [Bacillus carboniphilus]
MFHIFYLFFGFIAGYLMISFFPEASPLEIDYFLYDLISQPLNFVLAMVCLFFGFVFNSKILNLFVEQLPFLRKNNRINWLDLIIGSMVFVSFYLLFSLGAWQTILLIVFSVLYSGMTINMQRETTYDTGGSE